MKNIIAVTTAIFFFFFSFTVNAQNVNDKEKQSKIFGNQPIWTALTSSDTYIKMTISDYFSCKGKALIWNAVESGEAMAQEFDHTDTILVVNHNGVDYIYKKGCFNRLKFIRCITEAKPAPAPVADKKFGERPQPKPEPRKITGKLTFEVTYRNGDVYSVYTVFDQKSCELVRTEIIYREMIDGILTDVTYEEWQKWVCCHTQNDIVGLPYRNSGCPH